LDLIPSKVVQLTILIEVRAIKLLTIKGIDITDYKPDKGLWIKKKDDFYVF